MVSTGSLVLEMDENLAYDHILSSLKTAGVETTFQTPPNKIEFTMQKSQWGFKFGCEGEASISQLSGGKSNVVIRVKPSSNTVIYAVGMGLVLALIFLWLLGVWGVIVAIAAAVGLFWNYVVNF